MIKKSIIILMVTAILFVFLCFSVIILWKKGGSKREKSIPLENFPKCIFFFNETKQSINIIVNFKYTEEKLNLNSYYNKIDTIFDLRPKRNKYREIPIIYTDSITEFPENFNIKIIDSLGRIIKTYDKKQFLKNVENPKNMSQIDLELKEKSWMLKIKKG